MADERDAITCPLCGSPAWRHLSSDGDEEIRSRLEGDVSRLDDRGTPGDPPGVGEVQASERVIALGQAVRRLRSALIGVAERQEEHDTLPCYCVGEGGDGHQEWCVDARAALATTARGRHGRLRKADDLWAVLGLTGFGQEQSPVDARTTTSPPLEPPPFPRPPLEDPDVVLDRVKTSLPAGETGAVGDRVACERCGGAHELEAKNTLLWYQCADESFYLGGIDGRLLLPRAPGPEASP